MRILLISLWLLATSALAAQALPATPWARAEAFASCSGQMSALAAHQRALRDDAAEGTEISRESFDTLLQAVLPDAMRHGVPASQPKEWRTGGWATMAVLLADMLYSFDAHRADRARDMITARIRDCDRLVGRAG